jgi:deoxyribodipyrimidine photo-lyase
MTYENGLFIFRRDLRIEDNIALANACSKCKNVYTCFIFTPEQVGKQNKYKSNSSVQFMIEGLDDLSHQIQTHGGKLLLFYGKNKRVISHLIEKLDINSIFFNKDYTPYALSRDSEIQGLCDRQNIPCIMSEDYYLYEPGTIKNGTNDFYKKFTPFYNLALNLTVNTPININKNKIKSTTVHFDHQITLQDADDRFYKHDENTIVKGGRKNGTIQLRNTGQSQYHYKETRNTLSTNTSLLSAYIKFGCISVREVYHYFVKSFGKNSEILRQLIWREFYAHLLYGYPQLLDHKVNNPIQWPYTEEYLNAWMKGKTGFPVVDACMRQLNATGWMHNRGRLIASSFLVKTLLIDWRFGEQYFAKHLVDYDVASNNGNWQWISGTGVDSMPYFRVFNPWTQSEKFDADAIYIKKWIPELKNVDSRDLHNWNESCFLQKYERIRYPKPIVDFDEQRKRFLELYKK